MQKIAMLDAVDVSRMGTVSLRMKKIALKANGAFAWGWHRLTIEPGEDVERRIVDLAHHLAHPSMGQLSVDPVVGECARRTVGRVHTRENIEAFAEWTAKKMRGENPDIALDGAVVFHQTTALFKTIVHGDADRVDGAILARPVQIIAGFEPQPMSANFRLFPGEDIQARKADFEAQVAIIKAEDWTGVADMAVAEHTPDVTAKFAAALPGLIERGVLSGVLNGVGAPTKNAQYYTLRTQPGSVHSLLSEDRL